MKNEIMELYDLIVINQSVADEDLETTWENLEEGWSHFKNVMDRYINRKGRSVGSGDHINGLLCIVCDGPGKPEFEDSDGWKCCSEKCLEVANNT